MPVSRFRDGEVHSGNRTELRAHPPSASRSRRRKRWILPVAVLGSSSMKAMARGYL